MGARIINLADYRASRRGHSCDRLAASASVADESERFRFWRGASGKKYVHSVFSLIECPELPASNYVLARRDENGRPSVLAIGHLTNASPSLNLAELRQRAAQVAASEVHVHLLATTPQQAKMIEFDLRTGQFQDGAFGPAFTSCN